MKPQELRELDAEELGGRLKGARRELYELRFKLAVGQLDNHREVRKARKEIARILTVVHQRRLEAVEGEPFTPLPAAEVAEGSGEPEPEREAEEPTASRRPGAVETDEAEAAEAVESSGAEAAAGPAEPQEGNAEEAVDDGEAGGGPAKRRRSRRPVSEDEA
jgi:large subunit ribosomal protein L29